MGEISDMMLEGDLCECCGAYIDDEGGSGFPRYCSEQCARDRGALPEKKHPKGDTPFIAIKKNSDLQKLEEFINPINFGYYDDSTPDKKGNCMFKLYHDSKPHKDTIRGVKCRGIVVVVNVSMIARVKEIVEASMCKEG